MAGERLAIAVAAMAATVGAGYRLHELGRWGFWNDEAWVALSTRVEGVGQFLVAVACSPALWTLLLLPLAWLPNPEVSLRLLPLVFSLATLWLAWRLGRRLGGHALGGALAVLLVALDPTSIQYGKQLKQYSAEGFLMLAALTLAVDVACEGRHLRALGVLLAVGLGVSNAQLFVTPAVLGALLLAAIGARDRALIRRLVVVGAIVGSASLVFYLVVVRPWRTTALQAFWAGHYLSGGTLGAVPWRAGAGLQAVLGPGLGPHAAWVALAALVTMLATRAGRLVTTVIVLLVVELVVLARLELVPFGVPRLGLFYATAILVVAGAALAHVARAIPSRPAAAMVLAAGLALMLRGRPWVEMAAVDLPEDVGRLVRRMERRRRPDDRVLLYGRSLYAYGYYARRTPALMPFPPSSVGFVPIFDDPALLVVTAETVSRVLDQVTPGARRVWFVGSRFRGNDATVIAAALAARWRIDVRRRRPNALLLRASRR